MKFLCSSDTLAPNASLGFEIDGCKLLAVRRDGVAYFYLNRCPIAASRWNGNLITSSTPVPA